jgi:hypothetical protein
MYAEDGTFRIPYTIEKEKLLIRAGELPTPGCPTALMHIGKFPWA